MNTKIKYALLDRDGTLIFEPQDTYQIDSIEKLKLLDGVIEGLQFLQSNNFHLIMISNQDGLGTDSFPKEDFDAPQNAMLKIFSDNSIHFEEVFVCPHLPEDSCTCRKPKTGLLDDWLKTANIDTKQSFVCGDRVTDSELAKNLGLTYVPIPTNGNFYEAIR
jgi:imidazoleglycerol-phosphate dehydratase/histidinol-phosphatase